MMDLVLSLVLTVMAEIFFLFYCLQSFVLTFLAEWGDRSQIATIAVRFLFYFIFVWFFPLFSLLCLIWLSLGLLHFMNEFNFFPPLWYIYCCLYVGSFTHVRNCSGLNKFVSLELSCLTSHILSVIIYFEPCLMISYGFLPIKKQWYYMDSWCMIMGCS